MAEPPPTPPYFFFGRSEGTNGRLSPSELGYRELPLTCEGGLVWGITFLYSIKLYFPTSGSLGPCSSQAETLKRSTVPALCQMQGPYPPRLPRQRQSYLPAASGKGLWAYVFIPNNQVWPCNIPSGCVIPNAPRCTGIREVVPV